MIYKMKKLFLFLSTFTFIVLNAQKSSEGPFNQLIINFFKYPLMTIKIITSIHFEAFLLWKKGAIYRKRNEKILNNLSYEEY